jgi:nicotinic acid mononucleotide adenylyltransferase
MAAEAINLKYVDEVWLVPCGRRGDKRLTINPEHRLQMTKIIVEDFFPKDFPIKVDEFYLFAQ